MYKAETADKAKWSFQVPLEPPVPELVKKTLRCDAVVVGAGLGGLSAAVRLKELGKDVLLIEKSGSFSGRGGHFGVASSSLMEESGVHNDLQALARQWILMSGNNVDESLIWLYLNRGGEAMDWLLPKTRAAGLEPKLIDCRYQAAPYTEFYGSHSFPPVGGIRGNFVSKALYDDAVKQGVTVLFNTSGRLLIQEADKVVGIWAQDAEGWLRIDAPDGVVLATGDIGGDEEMCRAYAPDALRTHASQYVPVGCNTGDGHKMALWAGAAMAEEVFPIMMHPQHFAWLNLFFLFVNNKGRRFMNEDSYVQGRATAIMRQPGGVAYSLLDADWPQNLEESLKIGGGIFWGNAALRWGNPWTPDSPRNSIQNAKNSGCAWEAETLEELAELIGVPYAELQASVDRYNAMCDAGKDTDFGKRQELLYPIRKGPFVALKVGTVLLDVVGGVAIDTRIRALNEQGEPVPGLYVVGDTSGGMYGHEYVTTILGNSHGRALTWGYIAAETIANGGK